MECKFYVGQKVVCVDAAPKSKQRALPLVEGAIYTIRKIDANPRVPQVGLSFFEIPNMVETRRWTSDYDARRFRPAVETKTDISALRQIVADVMAGRVREAA